MRGCIDLCYAPAASFLGPNADSWTCDTGNLRDGRDVRGESNPITDDRAANCIKKKTRVRYVFGGKNSIVAMRIDVRRELANVAREVDTSKVVRDRGRRGLQYLNGRRQQISRIGRQTSFDDSPSWVR